MPDRDIISWNSIISGFSQHGRGSDVLDLFEEMKLEGMALDLLCACWNWEERVGGSGCGATVPAGTVHVRGA
jgi:pentatricopeptide repeat protein